MCDTKVILINIIFASVFASVASECLSADARCKFDYECCSKNCATGDNNDGLAHCKGDSGCGANEASCENHEDCCSLRCEKISGEFSLCYGNSEISSLTCKKNKKSCKTGLECCSKKCVDHGDEVGDGRGCKGSDYVPCVSDGICISDHDCCSKKCEFRSFNARCGGEPIAENMKCKTEDEECEDSIECCKGLCQTFEVVKLCTKQS